MQQIWEVFKQARQAKNVLKIILNVSAFGPNMALLNKTGLLFFTFQGLLHVVREKKPTNKQKITHISNDLLLHYMVNILLTSPTSNSILYR